MRVALECVYTESIRDFNGSFRKRTLGRYGSLVRL
jgi:hypothetical protein